MQIGITLIGIFAGAYRGATLSEPLAEALRGCRGRLDRRTLAFGLVVVATTYLSLIIGELVPKRLALRNAEGIAAFVSGPMSLSQRRRAVRLVPARLDRGGSSACSRRAARRRARSPRRRSRR